MRNLLSFNIVVPLLISIIMFSVIYMSFDKEEPVEWDYFTYTVNRGDNLYDLAEQYCPEDMDIRNYVYTVRDINDGLSPVLSVNQKIILIRKGD